MPRRPGPSVQPGPLSQAGRLARLLVITLLAVAALAVAPATATPQAHAQSPHAAEAVQQCPEVVVLTARGGAQQGQPLLPTRYSQQTPWVSNGHEDRTVRAFLQKTEDLYRETHGGVSLMRDVHVLGIEPRHHPSTSRTEKQQESTSTSDGVLQTLLLANRLAHPLAQAVATTANAFRTGMDDVDPGVGQTVREFESVTGCRPQYILIGAGEGATMLARQEQSLAERGQLAGVIYLGAPQATQNDTSVGGFPEVAGSLLRHLTQSRREQAATENRINYCLPEYTACDSSRRSASAGQGESGEGAYVRWDSEGDRRVMEAFASWVEQVRR